MQGENMRKTKKMEVLSRTVTLYQHRKEDFISLTDIAKHRDAERGDYIHHSELDANPQHD